MDTDYYPVIWLLLFSALGVALVVAWATFRWSKLKPALFPRPTQAEQDDDESSARHSDGLSTWLKNVPGILDRVPRALENEKTPEALTLLEASRKMKAAAPELPVAAQSVIIKALESGELSSLLLGKQGLYAYIVAVPNRHEHPHLIRRYAPFSAGWAEHADLVKASLMSSGAFSTLLSYLFFLSPDANEGILLMSYADRETTLIPSRLLQGSQLKAEAYKGVDAAMEFKMSD
jgi:hypothetical protein